MEKNYKKNGKKCKNEITIQEVLPLKEERLIKRFGSFMGQGFYLQIGCQKILLGCGSGVLVGLLNEGVDLKEIDILAIPSLKPKSFGDVFNFLNARCRSSQCFKSFDKIIHAFGPEKIDSTLQFLRVMSFESGSNTMAVKSLFGEMEYHFPDKKITMKSFLIKKKQEFGFIIKSYGKKIVYLSNFEFDDIKIHEKIKNSQFVILANRPSVENLSKFRELKRNLKLEKVIISNNDCPEIFHKYGTFTVLNANEPYKLCDFIDSPSEDVMSMKKKMLFEEEMFINISLNEKKFFSGKSFYRITPKIGRTSIPSLDEKRIRFSEISDEFRIMYSGKEEGIENATLAIREIASESVRNLEFLLNPIRFVDLIYLIGEDLINKANPSVFSLADKYGKSHLMTISRAPGKWELFFTTEEKETLYSFFIISRIK